MLQILPLGSVLGPLLFNIFINDLFHFIKVAHESLANDNTIATFSNSVDGLIIKLQKESEKAAYWFHLHGMSVIINRLEKESYKLIDNHKIDTENSVTPLGIEINKLNFGKHVAALCQKAGGSSIV